jgi:hypothetical protein
VGDAGVMLRHGSPAWSLAAFGVAALPAGLWLWHRQGPHFGLGPAQGRVSVAAAYGCLAALVLLVALGVVVDGQ